MRDGRHLVRNRAVEPELDTVEDEVVESPYALWVKGYRVDTVLYRRDARQRFECGSSAVRLEEISDSSHDGLIAAHSMHLFEPGRRCIVEHREYIRIALREGDYSEGQRPTVGGANGVVPQLLRGNGSPPFQMCKGDLAEVSAGLGDGDQGSTVSEERAPELVNLGGAYGDCDRRNLLHDVVEQLCRESENGPTSIDCVLER